MRNLFTSPNAATEVAAVRVLLEEVRKGLETSPAYADLPPGPQAGNTAANAVLRTLLVAAGGDGPRGENVPLDHMVRIACAGARALGAFLAILGPDERVQAAVMAIRHLAAETDLTLDDVHAAPDEDPSSAPSGAVH